MSKDTAQNETLVQEMIRQMMMIKNSLNAIKISTNMCFKIFLLTNKFNKVFIDKRAIFRRYY